MSLENIGSNSCSQSPLLEPAQQEEIPNAVGHLLEEGTVPDAVYVVQVSPLACLCFEVALLNQCSCVIASSSGSGGISAFDCGREVRIAGISFLKLQTFVKQLKIFGQASGSS